MTICKKNYYSIVFYNFNDDTCVYNDICTSDIDKFVSKIVDDISNIKNNDDDDDDVNNFIENHTDYDTLKSLIPIITESDIKDYKKRNNLKYCKRKRKEKIIKNKRKSDIAKKRKRVNGRFIKNTHKITSSI